MKFKPNQCQYPRRTAYIIAEFSTSEGKFRDVIKNIFIFLNIILHCYFWQDLTIMQDFIN